jgi:anti-sigma factor RsiW
MSESCREWRGELAAAALGHLEPDARLALQAHLDGCAACRAELAELTIVAGALPAADAAYVTSSSSPTEPPSALGEHVLGALAFARADERRRRRRRLAVVVGTAAAAVAAVIGLLVGGASLHPSGGSVRQVAFTVEPRGVDATAQLRTAAYGTEVKLAVSGLNDGGWYWLWLTGADGKRISAGTFKASGKHFTCDMTSALPLDKARRIWVTDGYNNVVLDSTLTPRTASS